MSLPMFMLDGKTAYYTCLLCQDPIGTVTAWMKHRATKKSHAALYTKSSMKSNEVKEVLISSSSSVLDLFPDGDQKCLTCIKTFNTNEELRHHEQEKEHKGKERLGLS